MTFTGTKDKFLICHKVFRITNRDVIKYILYGTNEYSMLEYTAFLEFLKVEFPNFKKFAALRDKLFKFDIIYLNSRGRIATVGNLFSEKKLGIDPTERLLKEYYLKVEETLNKEKFYEETNTRFLYEKLNNITRI